MSGFNENGAEHDRSAPALDYNDNNIITDSPQSVNGGGNNSAVEETEAESLNLFWGHIAPRVNECVELGCFGGGHGRFAYPQTAYIKSLHELKRLVQEAQDARVSVYFGINPRKEILYGRAPGQWVFSRGVAGTNADVTRRRFCYFDGDAIRATGFEKHNATNAEVELAWAGINEIVRSSAVSPGSTIVIFSGNGFAILTGVNMQNNLEANEKYKRFLQKAIKRFSSNKIKFDPVHDLRRVMKLPGIINFGKMETADRPTRKSILLLQPICLTTNLILQTEIESEQVEPCTPIQVLRPIHITEMSPEEIEKLERRFVRDCHFCPWLEFFNTNINELTASERDYRFVKALLDLEYTPSEAIYLGKIRRLGDTNPQKAERADYWQLTLAKATKGVRRG